MLSDGVDNLQLMGVLMKKNCVIAVVGPGNGASFARRFAKAGYQVAMLARTQDCITQLAQEIPNSYALT